MPSTRYQHRKTQAIVTAWQFKGGPLLPHDLGIPLFVWKAIDKLQVSMNHKGSLSVIGNTFIGFCEVGEWLTDQLEVIDNKTFESQYEFYA